MIDNVKQKARKKGQAAEPALKSAGQDHARFWRWSPAASVVNEHNGKGNN